MRFYRMLKDQDPVEVEKKRVEVLTAALDRPRKKDLNILEEFKIKDLLKDSGMSQKEADAFYDTETWPTLKNIIRDSLGGSNEK